VLRQILAELANVRVSVWLVLLVLMIACGHITWAFLGAPTLDNRAPSLLDLLAWLFWTAVLAVVAIWACWKKTDQGWRWRWSRH
jgi:hypothetical protein